MEGPSASLPFPSRPAANVENIENGNQASEANIWLLTEKNGAERIA